MNTKPSFELLKPRLVSLGMAYYGKASPVADPERTLLDAIRILPGDPKLLRVVLAWLEKVHDLIHVERIRSFADDLSGDQWVALGVVALKQVASGDRRFALLSDIAQKKWSGQESLFSQGSDPYLIEKHGLDKELAVFGIRAARIEAADPKKVLSLDGILKQHAWLRFRALIGANFRADVAYLMAHQLAQNAYQAAKILGCSQETSYRLWRGLALYPGMEKLVAAG